MNGETLLVDTDCFHAFPAPEDVFERDVAQHCEYLLPLASVCLSRINPDWQGEVHFVLPIEPHDGVVGDDTKDHHTYL